MDGTRQISGLPSYKASSTALLYCRTCGFDQNSAVLFSDSPRNPRQLRISAGRCFF